MDMDRMRELIIASTFANEANDYQQCGIEMNEAEGDCAYAMALAVADAFVAAAGRAGEREMGDASK